MPTVPASILPATRNARAMSDVYTVAVEHRQHIAKSEGVSYIHPRPYVVSFASAIASSSSLNVLTEMTGPKISSV